MTPANPWGDHWHNEYYSSSEMDELLGRILGSKCTFMGFQPAGKRKWVKVRPDGTMEVINLHPNVLSFYVGFGLSFPWIPHAVSNSLRWHKTPKSAVIDLWYERPQTVDWSIAKQRTLAAERANEVSRAVCEACGPWFAKMANIENLLEEFERRCKLPNFHASVQTLTAYEFWQAKIGKRHGLDEATKRHLFGYFNEEGLSEIERLLAEGATRAT